MDEGEKSRQKGKRGINVITDKGLKIAKVKTSVTLCPGQGKWIPLSDEFSQIRDNEFLVPVHDKSS